VESTQISALLLKILLVPMVGLWVFHLYQRRFKRAAERRRIATLSLTLVIIFGWVAAWLFSRYGVPDIWLAAVAAVAVVAVIWQRKIVLPYRLHCRKCGARLSMTRVLNHDSNLCEACEPPQSEGERS
jgi:hypothetical protein